MSSTLSWYLAPREKDLPDELKLALEKRWDLWSEREFTDSDIPFLDGLRVAGVKGADELIKLIEKHEGVYLKLSC